MVAAGSSWSKSGELVDATAPPRCGAAGAGLALAIVIGAALGIAMAWWRPVNAALGPLVEMFYPMPKSALIPVTVLWLGFGDGSKILLIFLGCMLPVTHRRLQRRARQRAGAGLVGAQHGREPVAHAAGTWWCRARCRSCSTASAPRSRSPSSCWSASELIVAREGLGYLIGFLGANGTYDAMFAVVLTVAFLGFAADRAYQALVHRVLRWRE